MTCGYHKPQNLISNVVQCNEKKQLFQYTQVLSTNHGPVSAGHKYSIQKFRFLDRLPRSIIMTAIDCWSPQVYWKTNNDLSIYFRLKSLQAINGIIQPKINVLGIICIFITEPGGCKYVYIAIKVCNISRSSQLKAKL